MKAGRSLTELAQEIERQTESKRDFLAQTQAVYFSADDNTLAMGDSLERYDITDNCHSQIAASMDIPVKYYQRMREHAPGLLERNVEHWFATEPQKRMVRTLDGKARAFLSERYRPLDNHDLLTAILPGIKDLELKIESCELTDTRLYLKAVSPKMQYEVRKGDVVQAGLVISNSEIGAGSLSIQPLVYRLICLNGAIMNDASMRRTHVGRANGGDLVDGAIEFFRDETRVADDRAFWLKVRDTVAGVFQQINFEKLVDKMQAALEDRVEADPVQVVEVTRKHFGFSDNERNAVLAHFLGERDMTRYGFGNAVTRAAQDVVSYDRSTELEKIGGAVFELPRSDWQRISRV